MQFNNQIFISILVAIIGIAILFPFHNLHIALTVGDNGRDLYAVQEILRGDRPYQNFWWVYGPLMPYVYAMICLILGVSIKNILIGNLTFLLFSGILIYFILRRIVSPVLAILGAVWLWTFNPTFHFTYNHIGGIVCVLFCALFTIRFTQERKLQHIYNAIIFATIASLIKLNIGFACLTAIMLSIILNEFLQEGRITIVIRNIIVKGALSFMAITAFFYSIFLYKLPVYVIRQCLPYISKDNFYHKPIWENILNLINATIKNIFSSPLNMALGFLIMLSITATIVYFWKKSAEKETKQNLIFCLIIIIFYLSMLHEYLMSGIPYRLYWGVPFQVILIFFFINTALKSMASSKIPILLMLILSGIAINQNILTYRFIALFKQPIQYLDDPHAKIYLTNPIEWTNVVKQTSEYLKKNLKPNEIFFALPYEPLYYFLLDQKSPSQLLMFFDHINVRKEQEEEIIENFKKMNVGFVVISNRSDSNLPGMGIYGKTYCPLLGKYISENFKEAAQFGDFKATATPIENHAVKILKKK